VPDLGYWAWEKGARACTCWAIYRGRKIGQARWQGLGLGTYGESGDALLGCVVSSVCLSYVFSAGSTTYLNLRRGAGPKQAPSQSAFLFYFPPSSLFATS